MTTTNSNDFTTKEEMKMASVKDLGKGKYRVFICNGFTREGKLNRTSKVIQAKSMADAKKQAQALEVDIKRTPVQLANTPTFAELVAEWRKLKKDKLELKTQLRYEGFLEQFMLPYFGKMKINEIRVLTIENYLKTLTVDGVRKDGKSGGYSEKTIRHHFMFLQTLLNCAVEWERLAINPCARMKAPVVHKKEANYYEDADIVRLLDCLDKECQTTIDKFSRSYDKLDPAEAYRRQQVRIFNDLMHKTYVWVALASACRRGELVGLRVDGVDFERNLIRITETGHYEPKAGLYDVERMKNGAPSKTVDMPVSVMKQLKVYLDARQNLFDLMGWEDSGYAFISLKEGRVTEGGGQIMPDVLSKWFSRFLKKHKLPEICLHEVCHTSLSYLINRGVDIKMVADRGGHQNTRTTEEIYSHIFAKTRRATANEYDSLFNSRVTER